MYFSWYSAFLRFSVWHFSVESAGFCKQVKMLPFKMLCHFKQEIFDI